MTRGGLNHIHVGVSGLRSTVSYIYVILNWKLINTLLKRFRGTPYYFSIYRCVKHPQVYPPPPPPPFTSKGNDPECPLILYHLNNASKLDLKLILHEKSVRNAFRQMQTVWGSNLRAMSMFELISKSYQFLEKTYFFTKQMTYGLGQDISCSQ